MDDHKDDMNQYRFPLPLGVSASMDIRDVWLSLILAFGLA